MNTCEQQTTTGISVNAALAESAKSKVRDDTRGGSEKMAPVRHRWHGQEGVHEKCSVGRKKVTLHT